MRAILGSLNAFSAAGLTAVLNTLWLALAVAAVMWFALRLMPRVNAATRHAVWWAVLALVVLMPLATLLPRPVPPVPLLTTAAYAPAPPITSVQRHALSPRAAAAPRVRIPIEFHSGNWPLSLLFLCLLPHGRKSKSERAPYPLPR